MSIAKIKERLHRFWYGEQPNIAKIVIGGVYETIEGATHWESGSVTYEAWYERVKIIDITSDGQTALVHRIYANAIFNPKYTPHKMRIGRLEKKFKRI